MKHNIKLTVILLAMFLITQFIGLYVIKSDPFHMEKEINGTVQTVTNPALSWIEPPEVTQQSDFSWYLGSVIIALIFAVVIMFLLIRFKISFILRMWFFVVMIIALFISLSALLPKIWYFSLGAGIVAVVFAALKMFRRNLIIHNLTELFIYPGIATVFVPILNFWTIIILLTVISIYDMWAVWHSGIMQKMAKYQINNLKIFAGFFIPYVSRKLKLRLKKMKKSRLKRKKIKVNLAILGGGDVIYPLIAAGVMLTLDKVKLHFGLPDFTGGIIPALCVVAGSTLGLASLLLFSEKKKFYPAMPFITGGIFIALILYYLASLIF